MKNLLLVLVIGLVLSGCAGGVSGYRWSAEEVSQITTGTPRSEILKRYGSPYQTTFEDYDSANPKIDNSGFDSYRYDGENLLTGKRTQEFLHIYYDSDGNVSRIKYNRNS